MSAGSGVGSILLFVFGAYAISWYVWMWVRNVHSTFHFQIATVTIDVPSRLVVLALGNTGPALSATLVLGLTEGWQSIRALWSRLIAWKLKARWSIFVCMLVPFVYSVGLVAYVLLGGRVAAVGNPIRWLLLIAVNLPFAPICEEIGWRGFLLPRLEAKYNGLSASVIVAVIWAPWHIPMYRGDPAEWWFWFLTTIFSFAVIFTWVYNRSGGSLAPTVLLHAMVDATVLYALGPSVRAYGLGPLRFVAGAICCAALAVVLFAGPDLSRDSLVRPGRCASAD